jgi:hypothetical protein
LVYTFNSISKACTALNPSKVDIRRSREVAVSRLKNKEKAVVHELGAYYFGINPKSIDLFTKNQKGRYPLYITDLETGIRVYKEGLKPAMYYLNSLGLTIKYDKLKGIYEREGVVHKKYKISKV